MKKMRENIVRFRWRFMAFGVALLALAFSAGCTGKDTPNNPHILVFQSDFGEKDGAVSAMKGVAIGVSGDLKIFDLTHEIPPFSVWDAAYRLYQTAEFYPEGTVFVSVVDPGVGAGRSSVVCKTETNQYFVSPDNGSLTLIAEKFGIKEVRQIDEAASRRHGSSESHIFAGRDVYAYVGARLAAGIISFEEVGSRLTTAIKMFHYEKPHLLGGMLIGTISALDIRYGNVWTNLDRETTHGLGIQNGEIFMVEIFNAGALIFKDAMPLVNSFGEVPAGEMLMYYNSLDALSFAINLGNFAETHHIGYGSDWSVRISREALN